MDPDSLFALCLIHSVLGGVAGFIFANAADIGPKIAIFAAVAAGYFQYSAVEKERDNRGKAVDRTLPGVIDLFSLCVSAGLALPQAMQQIVDVSSGRGD